MRSMTARIKLQTLFRRGRFGSDAGFRAHHAAANVVADRPHRNCAAFIISNQHAADGHTVTVVHIRRDDNHLHAGEAGGVDDLSIEIVFREREQLRGEKKTHRHFGGVLRLQSVVSVTVPMRELLPAMLVGQRFLTVMRGRLAHECCFPY